MTNSRETVQSNVSIPLPGRGGMLRCGAGESLVLICGPCVIESRDHVLRHAERIQQIASEARIALIFKASYDKANRTSAGSFRGVGRDAGLGMLAEIRRDFGVPVITDVHVPEDVPAAAECVDLLQIPAFLCRQTDLLLAAGRSGKPVMIKKGQMVAPDDMRYAVDKICSTGNYQALLCERGACFGYRDLVVDYRGIVQMKAIGCPVIFDATHSVQVMGGAAGRSSGNRDYVAPLARAAVAVGVDGVFLEAHEDPDRAPSDGPNMLPLSQLGAVLRDLRLLAELTLETRSKGQS